MDSQSSAICDPRLAVHARSPLPAWLWSVDGKTILWANPAGARLFGAPNAAGLSEAPLPPSDAHRRQVAQLGLRLHAGAPVRFERLRGFGSPLGGLMTCGCLRLRLSDGHDGILIVATEASGRSPLLSDGLQEMASSEPGAARPARPPNIVLAEPEETAMEPAPDAPSAETEAQNIGAATPTTDPAEEAPDGGQHPSADEPLLPRHQPLRFMWHMEADGRVMLDSTDFITLIGSEVAGRFGRPWAEIAAELDLDSVGRVAQALAGKDAFAGVPFQLPVEDECLPIELAAVPVYDAEHQFAGFKGFGVCRDLDNLNRLDALRRFQKMRASHGLRASAEASHEPSQPAAAFADAAPQPAAAPIRQQPVHAPQAEARSSGPHPEPRVQAPPNVVLLRPQQDTKSFALTPNENHAFNELARQLAERLEREERTGAAAEASAGAARERQPLVAPERDLVEAILQMADEPAAAPGHDSGARSLLDLLPVGILIYRLDRVIHANPDFLTRLGYQSLPALQRAGGLGALYVEAGTDEASAGHEAGSLVTITGSLAKVEGRTVEPVRGRLHSISWDGEPALALICEPAQPSVSTPAVAEASNRDGTAAPLRAGPANAEDLAAILDTTAEGVVMFDAQGHVRACNRSAEALFGYDDEQLIGRNLAGLFAPESRGAVEDYIQRIRSGNMSSLLEHGREVLGRERKGGFIPLSVTIGRTRPDGPNFFAVFRDLSQAKRGEREVREARRVAERAAGLRADMLARISHEVRTPLNAIVGFADEMIAERLGPLGNARYVEAVKDIRGSGERVLAIINDLLELTRIETGKLELDFAGQNLNDLVESCVLQMQPQASRERIIIRSSLAHGLPPVVADANALRQITINLISNSVRLAGVGGQVIVSTAMTDGGEVALRVRDTGSGLSERDVALTMEPFRTAAPADGGCDSAGLSLCLTRALTEANRAQFNIRTGPHSGTLIEVVFAPKPAES